jgi:hypothetical protein
VLKEGADYAIGDGVIELRIPWTLLNVSDPSSRRCSIRSVRAVTSWGRWSRRGSGCTPSRPIPRRPEDAPLTGLGPLTFTWPGWEEPRYRLEPKAGLPALRDVMRSLEPVP